MRSLRLAVCSLLAAACASDPTMGPGGPPGGGPDAGGPGTTPPTAFCGAQPVTRASTTAPELRAWVLAAETGACHLTQRTGGGVDSGFPGTLDRFDPPGTRTCGDDGCWIALPAFARAWTAHPAPAAFTPSTDPSGVQWTGMVSAARHETTGALRATLTAMEYGSSALRVYERTWDASGHLLLDRESFGGAIWFATTNTWDGDHLVASRFNDYINGTGETDMAWTWDGDHLARVTTTHLDSRVAAQADITVDAAGRPTAITRTVAGEVWATQAWTYDGDHLVSSATEVVPALLQQVYPIRGADDLEPLLAASTQLEWAAALPVANADGTCARAPHAVGYGYPERDGVYHLGWAVGDRPSGIDADYGFGPAYDSGMDRWFGHDRVEGAAWQPAWDAPRVRVEVAYDADGRMTTETMTTSDDSSGYVRTRTFDGVRVASDTRVYQHGADTLTTVLTFTHDDDDRVTERRYTMNNVPVGRHTWTYAGDRVASHGIAEHDVGDPFVGAGIVPDALAGLGALPSPIFHERRASSDGRTIEIVRAGEVSETRTLDDAGRLARRAWSFGGFETFAYEATGALREYVQDWEDDAAADLRLALERDGDRLLAREWSYTTTGDRDDFTWACD